MSTNLIENLYFNLFFLCVLFLSLMLVHVGISVSSLFICHTVLLAKTQIAANKDDDQHKDVDQLHKSVCESHHWLEQPVTGHSLTHIAKQHRMCLFYFQFTLDFFFFVHSAGCLCAETPSAVCTRAAQREQRCQLHERRLDNLSK